MMPLDPQARCFIEEITAENLPASHQVPIEEARRLARVLHARLDLPPEVLARIEDRRIPGPGGEIGIRIYTPQGSGPFSALVYLHGGGWVMGDLDSHQSACCFTANAVPCVVVAVDYRLSPENKFPAALEDSYAATRWVSENAHALNLAPGQLAVGGDSAGGNLAAAAALMARDRGGPGLIFQVLIYPVIDFNFDTLSYSENATGYFLTKEGMAYFWQQYLPSNTEGGHPYAAPLRAESLAGLPPALVLTAQYDPLRDEGQAYARRLREAGVPVVARNYEGLIHGFWGMGAIIDRVQEARQEVAEALRSAFGGRAAAAR